MNRNKRTGGEEKKAGQNAPVGTATGSRNEMKTQYRYYSPSISHHMVPAVKKHLSKIGTPLTVRGLCHGVGAGWYELVINGTAGKLVLRGCSWGYGGEGPRATRDVLVLLGIHAHEAERIAFTTPNKDVGQGDAVKTRRGNYQGASLGKEYFKLHLLVQPRWHDVVAPAQFHSNRNVTVLAASPDAALLEAGVLGCVGWTASVRGMPWRLQEAV